MYLPGCKIDHYKTVRKIDYVGHPWSSREVFGSGKYNCNQSYMYLYIIEGNVWEEVKEASGKNVLDKGENLILEQTGC